MKTILWLGSWLCLLASTAAAGEPLRIAVVPKSVGNEYWSAVQAGAMKARAELAAEGVAVEILWKGTEREDQIDQQKEIVADFVAQKVSALVLAPMHTQQLVSSVEAATQAKIPVILIDSSVNTTKVVSIVATDNYRAGMLAGRCLVKAIGAKGKVLLLRFQPGHSSTAPRERGFLDTLQKFPGIEVVSSDQFSGATTETGRKAARALLDQFGASLNGVFTPNLISTSGMLRALRETGLAGKVAFVGFDASAEHIDALRKGEMQGVVVQQPFMMGYTGVRTAVAAVQGKMVDTEIAAEAELVTKENLETPEIQRLLR
jgi:ribose transport system substrate-binding protein